MSRRWNAEKTRKFAELMQHLSTQGLGGTRTCTCSRKFNTHREMVAHVVFDHSALTRMVCDCGGIFSENRGLLVHQSNGCEAHREKLIAQRAQAIKIPVVLQKIKRTSKFDPFLLCRECDEDFVLATELFEHTTIIHGRRPTNEERTPLVKGSAV